MGPKPSSPQPPDMFRQPLIEQLKGKHPLVLLAGLIDWKPIEESFAAHCIDPVEICSGAIVTKRCR